MKVTVLIAVYNAEKFLVKCLDSLICQTHGDFEAICVDDCSTDGSLQILREYEAKDKRFKVLALKENAGQAKARNKAIEICTGDYVCFLDSDDWLAPNTLELCVEKFKNNERADCVLMKLVKVYEGEREEEYMMDATFPMSGKKAFELSLDWSIHGVYIVRTGIQKEIPYDDSCRSFSDDNTTRLHFLRSSEVDLSDGVYFYRQHSGSSTHKTDVTQLNFLLANEHMQSMLIDMNVDESLLTLHERVRWYNFLAFYRLYLKERANWNEDDCRWAQKEMKRIWKGIEPSRLPFKTRFKFGYAHLPMWSLFCLQEEIFFRLRNLLKLRV